MTQQHFSADFSARGLTPQWLADYILDLLPPDGTPVVNRVMRVLLSRELAIQITPEDYFSACDLLVRMGRIGRLRGQGGEIFLSMPAAPPGAASGAPTEAWSGARLRSAVRAYLEAVFCRSLDLPEVSVAMVLDPFAFGPMRSRSARPDFALVSAMRFTLLPGAQIDIHGFGLVSEKAGSVLAVHEAVAQTRFMNFGHLLWHLPEISRAEANLPEVEDLCAQHGLGLIRIRDPLDPAGYEIILDPAHKTILPAATEAFLVAHLSPDQKQRVTRVVQGPSSWPAS